MPVTGAIFEKGRPVDSLCLAMVRKVLQTCPERPIIQGVCLPFRLLFPAMASARGDQESQAANGPNCAFLAHFFVVSHPVILILTAFDVDGLVTTGAEPLLGMMHYSVRPSNAERQRVKNMSKFQIACVLFWRVSIWGLLC